jgi:hypothetical protein
MSVVGMLMVGGYLVYPKEPFFEYDGSKYYASDVIDIYEAKNGLLITIEKYTEDGVTTEVIVIDKDDAYVRLAYTNIGVILSITKGSLQYEDILEIEDITIDASLIKYKDLAFNYFVYQNTMYEDYSIVLYVLFSGCLLLGMIYLKSSISFYQKGFRVYGVVNMIPASMLIIFSLVMNITLIIVKIT